MDVPTSREVFFDDDDEGGGTLWWLCRKDEKRVFSLGERGKKKRNEGARQIKKTSGRGGVRSGGKEELKESEQKAGGKESWGKCSWISGTE